MKSTRFFAAAPWSRTLQASSALGTILLAGISIASYRAIPAQSGFTHYFGLIMAFIPPALLAWSLATTVTGYTVSQQELIVRQLFCSAVIPLTSIRQVHVDPAVCKGAVRLIGNAGLFGFTGLYRSPRLGRFRLFATDLKHAVVLELPDRTVVVTPNEAQAFADHVRRLFPAAKTAAP